MVYEVCAIVLTIIFGMLGLYLVLNLMQLRLILMEGRKTVEVLNRHWPSILDNIQVSTHGVKESAELFSLGFQQTAATLEKIAGSPVQSLTKAFIYARVGLKIWHDIRNKKKASNT